MRAFRHRHHHFATPTRLTAASTTAPPAADRRWFSPPVHGRRQPPTPPIVLSASPRPPRRQPPTPPIILSQARAAHGALGRGEPADRAARAAAALPHVFNKRMQSQIRGGRVGGGPGSRQQEPSRRGAGAFFTSLDVSNNRRSIARRGRRATWTVTRSHEERSVWGARPSLRDRAFDGGRHRHVRVERHPRRCWKQPNPLARATRHLSVGSPRCRARSPRRCGCSR